MKMAGDFLQTSEMTLQLFLVPPGQIDEWDEDEIYDNLEIGLEAIKKLGNSFLNFPNRTQMITCKNFIVTRKMCMSQLY